MNKIIWIVIFALVVSTGWLLYKVNKVPTVVYVKSAELVYGYEGMKEAQSKQSQKTNELKSNLDTLQLDFQKAINLYNKDFTSLSKEERLQREKILSAQQENLRKYSQSIEQTIKEKDEELTQGVLNQVNSFIEEYSKKQGYDIVFGTTASGNILYGKDYMDITKEVLEALNNNYKSKAGEN